VPLSSSLASTGGALNLISCESEALGRTTFSGAGAGRFPTANSILADMIAIAKGTNARRPFPRPPPAKLGLAIKPLDGMQRNFYVRGPAALADLLSVALWRQGRSVTPCGVGTGDADVAGAAGVKAFTVDATSRELASLVRRAAVKVSGGSDAAGAVDGLVKSVAAYPVYSQ
jgi:hypothetical protein